MQIQNTLTTTIGNLTQLGSLSSTGKDLDDDFLAKLNLALEDLNEIIADHQISESSAHKSVEDVNKQVAANQSELTTGTKSSSEETPDVNAMNVTPSWVNPSYYYDPVNPRKPNMREVMEALSGESVEALYEQPNDYWQPINNKANMLLYGVIGNRIDARDWQTIDGVSGKSFEKSIQQLTGDMYKPKLSVVTATRIDGEKIQVLELTGNHNLRKPLHGTAENIREALLDFGATKSSIPEDLEDQITSKYFDKRIIEMLKSFGSEMDA